jgi:hypothetical protein
MAKTHTLRWRKAEEADHNDEVIVWVDIKKLDECWRLTGSENYLAQGSGDRQTFEYLRAVTGDKAILHMPRIAFFETLHPKEKIRIWHGRHRFAFVRDHGGRAMPMTIPREEAARARFLFGSDASVCEVKV